MTEREPWKFKYTGGLEAVEVGHQRASKGDTVEVDDPDVAAALAEADDWEQVGGSKPRRSKAAREVEVVEAEPPPSAGG